MKSIAGLAGVCVMALISGCGGGSSPTAPATQQPPVTSPSPSPSPSPNPSPVPVQPWSWTGTQWSTLGVSVQACPSPLRVRVPIDLNIATSVLYPGQVRGDYKAHGGFRFDLSGQTADMTIVAPLSGYLLRGASYLASGERQYTLDWVHPCGVMIRLGHLRELAPKIAAAFAATIPDRGELDSASTMFPAGIFVDTGETVATATGLRTTNNIFIDWGVYDLRQRNASSADPAWLAQHDNDTHAYGVCWFSWLEPADETRVRALPPADGQMGRTSDYCR